jgi:hypothetical protein
VITLEKDRVSAMEPTMIQALAAAARAFADTLDPTGGLSADDGSRTPVAGSAESMFHVLNAVAEINGRERRGVGRREMGEIAVAAGMDPRGMAGYYTAASRLLEKRPDGRWITDIGRERLRELARRIGRSQAA